MKRLTLTVWFVGLFALMISSAFASTIWDATADFSNTNGNPNGAWTYGWVSDSAFQPYVTTTEGGANGSSPGWCGPLCWRGSTGFPLIWENTGPTVNSVLTGQLSLHPGPGGEMSVAQWTAPPAGAAMPRFKASFCQAIWASCKSAFSWMTIGIRPFGMHRIPGRSIFPCQSQPETQSTSVSTAPPNGYTYGNTPLLATITAVPEPAMLTLFCSALFGLGVVFLRRRRAKA